MLTHSVCRLGCGTAHMGALVQAHWQGLHWSISCGYSFSGLNNERFYSIPTAMLSIHCQLNRISDCLRDKSLHVSMKKFLDEVNWKKENVPWQGACITLLGLKYKTSSKGNTAFIALCCLTVTARWSATSGSCCHAFHARKDWTFNLGAKQTSPLSDTCYSTQKSY